ncbi:hypothetical protein C349_06813 [Cryptococcus neoformans var. grubii Br795]|uniref:Uncharacterized protein n=1 Tax=Cryptococcus neoformans Tu259-1 TaxID=1230072 RepID=A0A854QA87_CRYNE|nr:hypothetical protein C361_06894 [Cryptococcus neoformans var. grubii Tu259-1]OXG33440.1 hypothetical protein C359_06668 [Cryptococcus neoformans var. grubii Bt120]OXG43090.1 hypothetical protein C355_06731 [Cryptococcus neoformans var. grubii Th84]OXG56695.1 hypothetical protein C351_06754 [Cryptococcus neoformans var. grubii c8]OXG71963.1 hypothetical protein C350_06666 [Cryptococcus neoformans var. grubii MW-RSA36]OXG72857.1 hypothetical protein C349_06813 [Cryptococcus neoformans var. gr
MSRNRERVKIVGTAGKVDDT